MPTEDFAFICPYFHKTMGNTIFCEGFPCNEGLNTKECHFKQSFIDRSSRNRCIKKYCANFNYTSCAIAVLNDYKYALIDKLVDKGQKK